MAENSNYIGLAMGLDVTDLKAGLTEANAQIEMANAEFKSASSGMENWAQSIEGVSAKVKQLDSVLGLQKSKLAGLQAEYDKVAESQGENSEAAKSLRLAILKQEAVVNKTQKEYDNFKQTLEDAEAGIIDLEKVSIKGGKAVEKLGEEAEASSEGFTVLKGAMASLLADAIKGAVSGVFELGKSFLGLAESTREFREDQAKLNSSFEAAELSADSAKNAYKTLFGVIGEEDTAVEAAQQIALLAKSEEDVVKWSELATSVVATFGDALKPETFYEAANETVNLGEATGAFTQMLEQTGYSVDTFNDGLAKCTTEEEKQAYMLEITNKLIGEAGKAYEENAGDIIRAREAQAEWTQALAEYGEIVEPIMTLLKELGTEVLGVMKPFVELIAGGLLDALNGTSGATEKLTEGIGGLIDILLDRVVEGLPLVLDLISSMLPEIISSVVGVIPSLIESLAEQLPVIIEALLSGFFQIIEAIGAMLPDLIPVVIDAVLLIVDTLIENIDELVEAGMALLQGLADGLIKALPKLVEKIPVLISKLLDAISENRPLLFDAGIDILLELAGGIVAAIPDLLAEIPGIIVDICGAFLDSLDDMEQAGIDLIEGLIDGIVNFDFKGALSKVGDSIVTTFEDIFDMNSPSKVMAGLGEYLGEGVGVGMIDSLPTVKKNLKEFSGEIQDGIDVDVSGTKKGSARVRSGTVINAPMTVNYNGNLSRKQLKQIENDNYTAVYMQLKKKGAV